MIKIIDRDNLDLTAFVRPGDTVTWGQGTAEPLSLIRKLIEQRARIGKHTVFFGMALTDSFAPEHTDFITLTSYGAMGANGKLAKAGVLEILPSLYSAVPRNMAAGRLPVDIVFVQISPPGPDGTHSLGFCNDYLPIAMRRARHVIAEINPNVPWTRLDQPLDTALIDVAVESDHSPPPLNVPAPGAIEARIAEHIAGMIADGATLQYGIGTIPCAVLKALHGHRDLGIHSGLITEETIDLAEAGAVTNARKAINSGVSVGGIAMGGARMKDFLHDNPAIELHQATATHGMATLARLDNLVSINSALEVDLFGQVNAEQIGARYLGTIGGQVDYMHAATAAENGLSIIALPAAGGGASRIVRALNGPLVTTTRGDVDLVVTEHGVADLRGGTLAERADRLIAIAAPEHREALRRAA